MSIRLLSYGKINFSLHITGLDCKGYHLLDSVCASIDIGDEIYVEKSSSRDIEVFCEGVECFQNTAYKAAKFFQEQFKTGGVNIIIKKVIPFSAGLGGSSADAAGVLNALALLFDINDKNYILNIAKKCGSDTAYMIDGGFARLRGVGDDIAGFNCGREYDLVIVKPIGGVSANDAYKVYDKLNSKTFNRDSSLNDRLIAALNDRDFKEINKLCVNDLFEASVLLLPDIKKAYDIMSDSNAKATFMSGSGSSVVGVFESFDEAKKNYDNLTKSKMECFLAKTTNKGYKVL